MCKTRSFRKNGIGSPVNGPQQEFDHWSVVGNTTDNFTEGLRILEQDIVQIGAFVVRSPQFGVV